MMRQLRMMQDAGEEGTDRAWSETESRVLIEWIGVSWICEWVWNRVVIWLRVVAQLDSGSSEDKIDRVGLGNEYAIRKVDGVVDSCDDNWQSEMTRRKETD